MTSLAPAVPAGVTAVIEVALTKTMLVAETPPTVTVGPVKKPVPVIVIAVPPVTMPKAGAILLIVGEEAKTLEGTTPTMSVKAKTKNPALKNNLFLNIFLKKISKIIIEQKKL